MTDLPHDPRENGDCSHCEELAHHARTARHATADHTAWISAADAPYARTSGGKRYHRPDCSLIVGAVLAAERDHAELVDNRAWIGPAWPVRLTVPDVGGRTPCRICRPVPPTS
jgi:hypothetical protein